MIRRVLLFSDESGDLGRAGHSSASNFFSVGLVLFADDHAARMCQDRLDELVGSPRPERELSFRRDSHRRRIEILEGIRGCRFSVAGASLDKRVLAPRLPEIYVEAFVAAVAMLPSVHLARVVFDASGGSSYEKELAVRLRAALQGMVDRARAGRSRSDRLLQLADYAAGIANRLADERAGSREYVTALGGRHAEFRSFPERVRPAP